MLDQIDSKEGLKPPDGEEKKPAELSDQDLEMVSGGRGVVKYVDAASPKLHEACVTDHSK